ncbi:MAG: hypothetical protein M1570_01410 [Chloroflexi bacterium]|nr:hypothetical protein [Chloroflexota bacterium]
MLTDAADEDLAYRYVGPREAEEIGQTGVIPSVDARGNPKYVFASPNYYENAADAQKALQLEKAPTHRVTFQFDVARYNYAGNVENGTGIEMTTSQPIPALRIDPLR